MPVVVYRGGSFDVSVEPKTFQIDSSTGRPIRTKPPKTVAVTRKEIETRELWGVMFPKGVAIEVENDLAHKCATLSCFDVYGEVHPPSKRAPKVATRPLSEAPASISAPEPEPMPPEVEYVETKKRGPGRPRKSEIV